MTETTLSVGNCSGCDFSFAVEFGATLWTERKGYKHFGAYSQEGAEQEYAWHLTNGVMYYYRGWRWYPLNDYGGTTGYSDGNLTWEGILPGHTYELVLP